MSKSRNLATLLGSDGSVKTTKYVDEKGGVAEFVASGTLPNGVPVILKDDGTVEAVHISVIAESIPQGAPVLFETGTTTYPSVVSIPGSTDKFIIMWKINGDETLAVATVVGNSITFGPALDIRPFVHGQDTILMDPTTPGRFILQYSAAPDSGYVNVGNVTGTTITVGPAQIYSTTGAGNAVAEFNPNTAGQFIVGYILAGVIDRAKIKIGTISGTSITYSNEISYETGEIYIYRFGFSTAENKVVVLYNDTTNNANKLTLKVGTMGAGTISFGSSVLVSNTNYSGEIAFDPFDNSGKFIVGYRDTTNNNYGTIRVGKIVGTSVTLESEFIFNQAASSFMQTGLLFDPITPNQILIDFRDYGQTVTIDGITDTPKAVKVGYIAGNNITFGSTYPYSTVDTETGIAFHPTDPGKMLIVSKTGGSPKQGQAQLGQIGSAAPLENLTADNFIGISSATYADGETATVTLAGALSDNQTGLTTNSVYYVQTDGTLTTTAGTPSVEAGRAISSTSLLLTSEAGAAGADGSDGIQGIQGIQGAAGLGIQFLGQVATTGDLPTGSNTQGDAYIVQADDSLHVWDGTSTWVSGGSIQGPQGIQGSQGNVGAAGSDGVAGSAGTDGAAGVVAPPTRVEFTATENQATKTGLTYTVGNIDCYINGVKMSGSSFTASDGVSVTFTPALSLGEEVQLIMGAAGASGLASTVSTTDPLITSNPSALGHVWVNSTNGMTYVCTDITVDMNIWFNVGLGSLSVSPPFMATGGTITTVGNYKIHTFLTSGTFTPNKDGIVDYLVIAGGGSGGAGGWGAGGGGAGGLQTATGFAISNNNPITVTVGAGGAAAVASEGVSGSNSVFSTITSIGGGGGAISSDPDGLIGGSGGGGTYNGGNGGSGTSGQGNAGGSNVATYGVGAGGGGASGAGSNSGILKQAGAGGDGSTSILSGSSVTYAGGGGGGTEAQADRTIALGGSGGGGNGGKQNGTVATAGTDNTGSGGGGAGSGAGTLPSGSGGSGIVIIRYAL